MKQIKLDIIENPVANSYQCRYRDKPFLLVRKRYISISPKLSEILGINKKSIILLSTYDNYLYIANITDTNRRGFTVHELSRGFFYILKGENINSKLSIEMGDYAISTEPYYDPKTQLDWYYTEEPYTT